MLVYRVKNELEKTDIVWDNYQDAIYEIQSVCELEEKNKIILSIEEMPRKDFEALPEFEGY